MKYSEFLKKTNLESVKPFNNDDIGKNTDVMQAIKTLFDFTDVGRNEPMVADPDDYNDLDMYVDAEGTGIDRTAGIKNMLTDIWTYVFGFCSCGNPDKMWSYARDVLVSLLQSPVDRPPAEFESIWLLYELDRVHFTDHGSSIFGSVLTPAGWAFTLLVDEYERNMNE